MSQKIPTKDAAGNPNGWLLPIWHADDGPPIDQVYLTVVAPGTMKGPHLHMRRRGLFCCIRGLVRVVWREPAGNYVSILLGNEYLPSIAIPPGTPAAIYNRGSEDAYVLNMPSPPWRANEPDEWPVEDWTYDAN